MLSDREDKSYRAITVRVAEPLYELLREHARSRDLSLNSVVAEAIAQYSNRIQRTDAIDGIEALQAKIRLVSAEHQSDSTRDLRELRESRDSAHKCCNSSEGESC